MTEAEWLACDDPNQMFHTTLRSASRRRKYRLFAVSCCRLDSFNDPRSQKSVEVAERHAEGLATDEELNAAREGAVEVHGVKNQRWEEGGACLERVAEFVALPHPFIAAEYVCWAVVQFENYHSPDFCEQANLLRDIFGNPFRPVVVDASWLTSDVIALAESIYHEKAFDRMPILADALQDAGCDNDDILNHCRQPGEHVRGCWVVDLLLGKK